MNSIYLITGMVLLSSTVSFGQENIPDQNPNFENSRSYYMDNSASLTENESQTTQDTYVAYDWRRAQEAKKQDRKNRRYEYRKMRYNSRNRYYNRRCNNGYNNNYGAYNYNTPYNNYSSPYYYGAGLYSLFH